MCARARAHTCLLSCSSRVQLFATPWTVACQAPLSMGFSRQGYWSGLLCSSPGHPPNPGIEPKSLMSPALAGGFLTTSATWEVQFNSATAAAATKSHQSCPTLCDPIDGSPPGSPVPGFAKQEHWSAIFFSNAWKWKVKVKSPSRVRL